MERSRTAERHHRITTRVAALLDGHNAYGMFHVVGCNQMDAPCRVFRCERQRPSDFSIDHSFRTIKIERDGAVIEKLWIEITQNKVGICYGRRCAAAAIADRSRLGTCTFGAHNNRPTFRSRDTAATGPNLQQLHRRCIDR